MMLYGSPNPAPNPRRVRIYLAEKGIDVPSTDLSIPAREHKAAEFVAKNPRGQTPALELDDGTVIAESVAICRWFEETMPDPPLFGRDAREKALVDMWTRRAELVLMMPVGQYWVNAHPYTRALPGRHEDYGEANRDRAASAMRWFDGVIGDGWLATDDYTIADIVLLTTIDFAGWIGVPVPDDCARLKAWHERATARPSTAA